MTETFALEFLLKGRAANLVWREDQHETQACIVGSCRFRRCDFLGAVEHGDTALVRAISVATGTGLLSNRLLLSLRDQVVLGSSLERPCLPAHRTWR